MKKVIAIVNQKGGVGKTTTAVNLSSSLAILKKRVLVIDLDSQANSTSGLGLSTKDDLKSIYDSIIDNTQLENIVQKTEIEFLDIIPSSISLVGAEVELISMEEREFKIKKLLECKFIDDNYDYIILDCAPSLGLITINALAAARSTLIPVQCEYYALEGLSNLFETIKIIQTKINTYLEIEGILLTMYDHRLKLANQVVSDVKEHFSNMEKNK